ncbi:MAG TPA: hypothetical protein VKB88_44775 [Bryobacteraceae bacterium]|nr:hypothetical protein [Bryobacteraceae bacterium]
MRVCGWKTRSMFDRSNTVAQCGLNLFRHRMNVRVEDYKTNHKTSGLEDPFEGKEEERLSRSN